jgi:Ni/Co efflux regulator RcnB
MQRITMHLNPMLAILFAGILATGPALADKPEWAGSDKSGKHEQKRDDHRGQEDGKDTRHDRREGDRRSHFGDREREIGHSYFAEQFRKGRCPHGLAKKHNGCMPPGQARKWSKGRPLPRDVIFYELPHGVLVQLSPPPAGHRYVRVAADILLIAIGTGMVVDAIEDLGNM